MTHGKTYNKSPRRINQKATKSKTNTGTTALERSVEQTTGGFKALLQLTNFTLGPDVTLNTEIHIISVRIKAPNSVNASKRKHKNQINHYNKQRRVRVANSTVCQSKWKPVVEPRQLTIVCWKISLIKGLDIIGRFSPFYKGDYLCSFLIAFPHIKRFLTRGLLYNEIIFYLWDQILYFLEKSPFKKVGKTTLRDTSMNSSILRDHLSVVQFVNIF